MDRREAIRRVTALLGGVALVGGSALLTACERDQRERAAGADGRVGEFTRDDIALLDEVAETILPETETPGAKAAKVGPFMALMVTDTYGPREQKVFRDGMRTLDEASRRANNAPFLSATPQQRLALLETLDREQKADMDARGARTANTRRGEGGSAESPQAKAGQAETKDAETKEAETKQSGEHLPDQRQEAAVGTAEAGAGGATAITADAPPHYFRMMKELALLGYFTSEVGYTQAMRYVETPGRYDPCAPYKPGERAWAPHA